MEIIKAGLKLRRRVAGQTVFFRGYLSAAGQLQVQEEIATLQIGLDRPGTRLNQVLGFVNDAGVTISWIWEFNQLVWTLYPYGGDAGAFFQFGAVIGLNGGLEEDTETPNILPVWSEDEGKMMEYHLYNDPGDESFTRSGDIWTRRLDFSLPSPLYASTIAPDFKKMIPRGTVTFNTVDGVIQVTYGTKFKHPAEDTVVWTGPIAAHGNLFAIGAIEGKYVNGVKPDIFR